MLNALPTEVYDGIPEATLDGGTYSAWDDLPEKKEPEEPQPVDTTEYTGQPTADVRQAETTLQPVTVAKASAPYRELRIGHATIDADYDVWVRGGNTGAKTAQIRLWNIDSATWKQIVHGTPVEVDVGWHGTDTETVFRGFTRHKRRERIRRDTAFTVNVSANSYAKLSSGYSGSWNNVAPHRIASYIAEKAGFDRGYISHTSEPIDSWVMTSNRELKYWLDKLARDAGKAATSSKHEDPWVWYTSDNKLHFHSRTSQPETPRLLETGSSLLRASPTTTADRKDLDDHAEITFDCRMEPWIDRGSVVRLKGTGIDEKRLYRVKTIEYETSKTQGRHHIHCKASPVRVVDDSKARSYGKLPPSRPEKDRTFHNTTPTRQ
jgi:hypothetical protein